MFLAHRKLAERLSTLEGRLAQGVSSILNENQNAIVFATDENPKISSVVKFGPKKLAIVTNFDAKTYTALKIPQAVLAELHELRRATNDGPVPDDGGRAALNILSCTDILKLPKASNFKENNATALPLRLGIPEIDLLTTIRRGSKIAFIGNTGLTKRFRDRILKHSPDSIVLQAAEAQPSAGFGVLSFMLAIQRAAKTGNLLVISNLKHYEECFEEISRDVKLPFTFATALSAALSLPGVATVTFAESAELYGHSIGLTADHCVEVDAFGKIDLRSILRMKPNFSESWKDRLLAQDVRERLEEGFQLEQEIALRKELKIHVDFWEEEELVDFKGFKELLSTAGTDVFAVRAGLCLPFDRYDQQGLRDLGRIAEEGVQTHFPEIYRAFEEVENNEESVRAVFSAVDAAIRNLFLGKVEIQRLA